jgi:diguanylate cyclase (GGDEF)-like protein/PAS domain S-box-containing protein
MIGSDVKYRQLYENLMDAYASVDMNGRITHCNGLFRGMLGYEPEELLTRTYADLTPEKWHAVEAEIIENQVIPLGFSEIYEKEYRRKDGTTFPVELRTCLFRDDAGTPCGMWAIVRDITVRKRTEDALVRSEYLYRTIFENSLFGIAITGPDFTFTQVNDEFCRILEYDAAELIGIRTIGDITFPDDIPASLAMVQKLMSREIDHYVLEKRYLAKSGRVVEVILFVRGLYESDGRYLGGTASILDITRRKHIEQAFAESEKNLQAVLDNMPAMIGYWDRDLRNRFGNKAYKEWFGLYADQMRGLHIREVIGEKLYALNEPYIKGVLQGEPQHFERAIRDVSGKDRYTQASYIPDISDGRVNGFFVLVAEITEQKRLEKELETLAQTDPLTKLANRRHFMELTRRELARTGRYGGTLSMLMLDVDHFKRINDSHGHQAGDTVLQKLAELCVQTLREVDIVGRMGGEEFAILLPEADNEQAREVAERLRRIIADSAVPMEQGPICFTVSIGVATTVDPQTDIDMLLNQADQALYDAKHAGRNRVCSARQPA